MPDCLVTVTSGGNILRSTNGDEWVQIGPAQNPFAGDVQTSFRDVAFGNGNFVAVGVHYAGSRPDAVLTSPDGANWTELTQVLSNALYGVTFANGIFVAVGGQGNIWYSTNGLNWFRSTPVTSADLHGVAFGQGLFVAVGYWPSTILTSQDGVSWSSQSLGSVAITSPGAIGYGQGRFIVGGDFRNYLTSTDGTNWLQATLPWTDAYFYPSLESVIFAQNTFLAIGSALDGYGSGSSYGILFASPDGQAWTQKHVIPSKNWADGVPWNDSFIVVGDGIMRSQPFSGSKVPPTFASDPQSTMALVNQTIYLTATGACYPPLNFQWQRDGRPINGQTNTSIVVIAAMTNAGAYTIVASNSTGSVTSTPASLIVVDRVKPVPPFVTPATLGKNFAIGVQISANATASYSWRMNQQNILDATNSMYNFTNVQLSQAAPYDVIVSNFVGLVTNRPLYVTVEPYSEHPLYHWVDQTPPGLPGILGPYGWLSAVAYGNGCFVTVGSIGQSDLGVILSSCDGATWALRTPQTNVQVLDLYDLAFGNGVFVAVGYISSIYSSTNGADWVLRKTGAYGTSFDRVVFTNGYFWVGRSQTFRSSDGVNWQSVASWPGYSSQPAYGGGIWATSSNSPSGIYFSTNASDWTLGFAADSPLYDVAFGRGVFVAVGQNGTILRSEPLAALGWANSQPLTLAVRGLVGGQYAIEHRSVLTDRNWAQVATVVLTNNPTLVPNVLNQTQDFFRVKLLP